MTPYAIGTVVALTAAGAAVAIGSIAASFCWRLAGARLARLEPRLRARLLATLRLLPAGAGLGLALAVAIAFVRLEPADAREVLGAVLPSMAALTAGAFALRATRAGRAWARTERLVARWPTDRHIVDADFPIVAVVGIWRPRLYVARRVVDACDAEELDAMIAHERAHIAARDNVTRLAFLCAPFAVPRVARALEEAWTRASEEAADDAARRDARTSLALASALTKVARLAVGQPMPLLHASAIFSGSSVSERVQRLLQTVPPATSHTAYWRYVAALAVMAMMSSAAAMRQIYDVAEYCVRHLP
jgi:Zn-dependent protease with chaperone function